MLMQNFGVTKKEYYGMLWYFLYWSIGLICTTTSLHVHHPFFYISLPSLQDYDLQMPNFTFYGGRKQAMTKFSFFL